MRLGHIVLSAFILALGASGAGQFQVTAEKVVVSYASKSITNFPILETAKQKGFFQKESLSTELMVSVQFTAAKWPLRGKGLLSSPCRDYAERTALFPSAESGFSKSSTLFRRCCGEQFGLATMASLDKSPSARG